MSNVFMAITIDHLCVGFRRLDIAPFSLKVVRDHRGAVWDEPLSGSERYACGCKDRRACQPARGRIGRIERDSEGSC
jgi:hypothetical protein